MTLNELHLNKLMNMNDKIKKLLIDNDLKIKEYDDLDNFNLYKLCDFQIKRLNKLKKNKVLNCFFCNENISPYELGNIIQLREYVLNGACLSCQNKTFKE